MANVHQCDLCKEVNRDGIFRGNTKYCSNCNDIINTLVIDKTSKFANRFNEEHGRVIDNQVKVLKLMKWLNDDNGDVFTMLFGEYGLNLLTHALEE